VGVLNQYQNQCKSRTSNSCYCQNNLCYSYYCCVN